jgi:cytochrome c oxidase subunit 2
LRRHPLAQMIVIGVVASAIGIVLALAIDWFPTQASSQAPKIDNLFDVLLVVSVPIFVLVEVVVLFSVWKFRMRPGEELKDGVPIHGNTKLEVVWTTIPALLLVGLCSYAYVVLRDIEKAQPNTMVVNVTGEQFAWTFEYPPERSGAKPVSSDQLYLPKGRPVRFNVRSRDVIHDFWVPNFRMKIDAVPGITTHYRITPTRLGTYAVVCAELCGLGHAAMRDNAHVITPAAFRAWMAKQRAPAGGAAPGGAPSGSPNSTADLAANGKQVFTQGAQPPCASCHTLADAASTGTTGPNLNTVLKGKNAAFIRQSIQNPNAQIAKGFAAGIMPPSYGSTLSPQELNALVAYLEKVAAK